MSRRHSTSSESAKVTPREGEDKGGPLDKVKEVNKDKERKLRDKVRNAFNRLQQYENALKMAYAQKKSKLNYREKIQQTKASIAAGESTKESIEKIRKLQEVYVTQKASFLREPKIRVNFKFAMRSRYKFGLNSAFKE